MRYSEGERPSNAPLVTWQKEGYQERKKAMQKKNEEARLKKEKQRIALIKQRNEVARKIREGKK